jgi:hypothetical protein
MADESSKTADKGHEGKPEPYSKAEVAQATKKMFEELARLRGGKLILGCCTQGCCA